MNITIQSQKLLLVEGEDEKSVFTAFLDTLKITDVQVIVCGGNVQFKIKFPNIVKIPGFDDVMVYEIIQDADTNYNSTFQSIQNLLSVTHQPVPRDAEVFVEKNAGPII